MHATEIQDHARKLMEASGPRALADAAQKARAFEEKGEKEQAKDWRRIEAALRHLQGPRES